MNAAWSRVVHRDRASEKRSIFGGEWIGLQTVGQNKKRPIQFCDVACISFHDPIHNIYFMCHLLHYVSYTVLLPIQCMICPQRELVAKFYHHRTFKKKPSARMVIRGSNTLSPFR